LLLTVHFKSISSLATPTFLIIFSAPFFIFIYFFFFAIDYIFCVLNRLWRTISTLHH
jgi:hypothetical protein